MPADRKPLKIWSWVEPTDDQAVTYLGPLRKKRNAVYEPKEGLVHGYRALKGDYDAVNTSAFIQKFPQEDQYFSSLRSEFDAYYHVSGLYVVGKPGLPLVLEDRAGGKHIVGKDILESQAYWQACHEMQHKPQGKKAMELLKRFLTPVQIDTLENRGFFVEIKRTHLEYALVQSYKFKLFPDFMVYRYLNRFCEASFCWHPKEPIPLADLALTHLLAIRDNEKQFLKSANW